MLLRLDHVTASANLELSLRQTRDGIATALDWTVRNTDQAAFRGVVRLVRPLPERFTRPWIMVPGFFYGENRRVGQRTPKLYPRFDPQVRQPTEMTSSWWDFAADRTASPLVYVHQDGACLALAAEPHYDADDGVIADDAEPQLGIGFAHDGRGGYLRFSVPACEEPFTYNNKARCEATIRRLVVPSGATIRGRLYLYEFEGAHHDYQRVLEDYVQRTTATQPAADLPEVVSLAADAAHGVTAGHYHRGGNYFIYSRPYVPVIEQIANGRGVTMEWHQMLTGFVNGFPVCHGLLRAAELTGDAEPCEVAVRVADRICREGLSPVGLFWADYVPRTIESANGSLANPLCRDRDEWGAGWQQGRSRLHGRTVSDACYHLAGMIETEQQRGNGSGRSVQSWREALETNLRTILSLQLPNGSYGQQYDATRPQVVEADGCGGLLWIPAMLRAIRLGIGDAKMAADMEASVRRAADAYAAAVEAENIWGAPEDNDSPSSEDGMNAVVAYTELYAATDEPRHLDLARRAADWMLSFRKTFNGRLPPNSLIGRYGLRSRGGDVASVSNNMLHVFEVMCTRHLCDLSRWTGNPYYHRRARDHWAYACQLLSRADGMYNGFRGAMAEQFYWSDWGSWNRRWLPDPCYPQKGTMAPFTAVWCLAALLVAAPDARGEFGDAA